MGMFTDYFVAPSDETAALTIDRFGGPGMRPKVPAATLLRRALRRNREDGIREEPVYPTVALKNIDPVVQMGTLEEILTGRTFEEILGVGGGGVIAERNGGEQLVIKLTSELTNALATLPAEKAKSVGLAWSQTEEFGGLVPSRDLTLIVLDLADLARRARAAEEQLYCWLCL
jgi:hypothetical protein